LMLGTAVLWRSGILSTEYEGGTLDAIRDSLVRDEKGALVLRPTPELAALRAEVPNFWFIARDEQGHRLSEGEVPDQFKAVAASLD
ncbi:hypothetical protein, partial [Escherichia coli]|uniref:hypothetical protein n=1 Tax=Escherichia coli TaxID=562 RepID=UPI001953D7D2